MTNYHFPLTIEADDGEAVECPLLVHELYSRPYSLIGVPEWASTDEIDRAIEKLEAELGYELERPSDLEDIRLSDEEVSNYLPKTAGFDPITGKLMAR